MFQRVGDSHTLTVPDWYDPTELVTRFAATGIPMTEEMKGLVKLVGNGKKSVEDIFPTPSFELVSGMQIRVRALNLVAHATMTMAGCVEHLESEDALFPGMFGLMLAYLEIPDYFETQPMVSKSQRVFPFYSFVSPDLKDRAFRDDQAKVRSPYIRYKHQKPDDTGHLVYLVETFGHGVYKLVGHLSLVMMFRHVR